MNLLTQIKHKTQKGEEVVMDIGAKASNVLPENFVEQQERSNLAAKDKLPVIFGKLSKWYTDLKAVAWSGSYSDLTNKPTIPEGSAANYQVANNDTTEAEGFVADARIVRTHGLEIDGLSRNLGGLSFAQDSEGNWGYKIGGADPVIPFKTEPLVYDFSDGTFNLSDSSKPYYVKDYKKLTKQNFHGSCSWSCYEYFHHTDTADHEHRNSGGISFTYSSDTGILTVKRNQTNGFITLVC